ncbi:hypothetical protein OH77DRAFT_524154 [Trametes cingulata]|nr:hypothetical protein OH77DRAFT_524154 [Trametes cingulata]
MSDSTPPLPRSLSRARTPPLSSRTQQLGALPCGVDDSRSVLCVLRGRGDLPGRPCTPSVIDSYVARCWRGHLTVTRAVSEPSGCLRGRRPVRIIPPNVPDPRGSDDTFRALCLLGGRPPGRATLRDNAGCISLFGRWSSGLHGHELCPKCSYIGGNYGRLSSCRREETEAHRGFSED